MSSTSTTRLGLFKPTPGSGEPFRTSDVNSNMDKIDAEAVAVDARLDVVEPDVITAKNQLGGIAAAWVSYTPTLGGGLASGFTVNNAFYGRLGKTILVRGVLSCTGAAGSGLTVTLPVEAKANVVLFTGFATKSTGLYPLSAFVTTNSGVSKGAFYVTATNAAYAYNADVSTSVPATWTSDDSITFSFVYEGV